MNQQLKDADGNLMPPGGKSISRLNSAQQSNNNLKASVLEFDVQNTPEESQDEPKRGKRKGRSEFTK